MLELIVVFGLAAIGVFFTTTTNDPEAIGHGRSVKDGFAMDEDGGGGIGVLGVDVAKKSRRSKLRRKAKSDSRSDAETLADIAQTKMTTTSAAHTSEFSPEDDATEIDDTLAMTIDIDQLGDAAEMMAGQETDMLSRDDALDAAADPDEADFDLAAFEQNFGAAAPDDTLDDDAFDEAFLPAALDLDARPLAASAKAVATPTHRPRTKSRPARLRPPPVIEDFDPAEDQIMISYRPCEAGNGRIGISEDPEHPGTARVTLGGRVVALVPGGFGKVRAHHIDLYLEDTAV